MTTPGRSAGPVRVLGSGLGAIAERPDSQLGGKSKNSQCARCGIDVFRRYGRQKGYCRECSTSSNIKFMEGNWDARITAD